MLCAPAGDDEVGHRVDPGSSQKPGRGREDAAGAVGLVHEVEGERGDEHPAAEGHDGGDDPGRQGHEVGDRGTQHQG